MSSGKMTSNGKLNEKFGYKTIGQFEQQELAADDPRMRDIVYNSTTIENAEAASKKNQSKLASLTTECCYSISNLALIIASVIALIVLIRFNSSQDSPLYDYGDHLLSSRFYYQLIYMIVIVALVLLIPLYNAASVFLFPNSDDAAFNRSILIVKIIYQILMLILVFIALVFISPYISSMNLSSRIELELAKHMKYRYDEPYSYHMLNHLQEEYECCDELWYRANMRDHLPTSCFVPDSNYSLIYDDTCPHKIAYLVSNRCSIIAISLIIILIALICLIIYDFVDHRSSKFRRHGSSGGHYKVNNITSNGSQQQQQHKQHHRSLIAESNRDEDDDDYDEGGQTRITSKTNRRSNNIDGEYSTDRIIADPKTTTPKFHFDGQQQSIEPQPQQTDLVEVERPTTAAPLLLSSSSRQQQQTVPATRKSPDRQNYADQLDDEKFREQLISVQQSTSPTILTRANYQIVRRDRSQSPVFLSKSPTGGGDQERQEEQQGKRQEEDQIVGHDKWTTPDRPTGGHDDGNQTAAKTSTRTTTTTTVIKSALKKTSSIQRIEFAAAAAVAEDDNRLQQQQLVGRSPRTSLEEDAESSSDYAEKLRANSLIRQHQQEQQTKRSLLNVRFADSA